jgi:hypothetical protein
MAFHNTNWSAVPMPIGTYTTGDLGNGLSASTVHEVFCTADGVATITAMGGGTFTFTATAGQSVNVVVGNVVVASGSFVGFKAHYQQDYRQQSSFQ